MPWLFFITSFIRFCSLIFSSNAIDVRVMIIADIFIFFLILLYLYYRRFYISNILIYFPIPLIHAINLSFHSSNLWVTLIFFVLFAWTFTALGSITPLLKILSYLYFISWSDCATLDIFFPISYSDGIYCLYLYLVFPILGPSLTFPYLLSAFLFYSSFLFSSIFYAVFFCFYSNYLFSFFMLYICVSFCLSFFLFLASRNYCRSFLFLTRFITWFYFAFFIIFFFRGLYFSKSITSSIIYYMCYFFGL